MDGCTLCPRRCGANRQVEPGDCGETNVLRVGRAALHAWEEPCISGQNGSGAVFFTGCSLRCVYCQNGPLSRSQVGKEISVDRLCEIFFELADQGAQNINLVTGTHFIPQICAAIRQAKEAGLTLPIVYNTSGYERVESLRALSGLVDVYLPDFKYMQAETAARYSKAPDYPDVAKAALKEMVAQQPRPTFDDQGRMTRGVLVRHLLLPGHVREAKSIVSYLYQTYGDTIYISLLSQYTPMSDLGGDVDPLLTRRVTKREYESLVTYAIDLGVENGYVQEADSAVNQFIPSFDLSGV